MRTRGDEGKQVELVLALDGVGCEVGITLTFKEDAQGGLGANARMQCILATRPVFVMYWSAHLSDHAPHAWPCRAHTSKGFVVATVAVVFGGEPLRLRRQPASQMCIGEHVHVHWMFMTP